MLKQAEHGDGVGVLQYLENRLHGKWLQQWECSKTNSLTPAMAHSKDTAAAGKIKFFDGKYSMSVHDHVVLMASYNQWMNVKLYEAAGKLTPQELARDRQAFFGSLLGTLNHIVVADTMWLKRFALHPANHIALDPVRQWAMPSSLDQIVFADFAGLLERRNLLDNMICAWAASLTDHDLEHVLQYTNTKGVVGRRKLVGLVLHFFNHQTHHRGQATTLLHQVGQDVGSTDLLALLPNEDAA